MEEACTFEFSVTSQFRVVSSSETGPSIMATSLLLIVVILNLKAPTSLTIWQAVMEGLYTCMTVVQ